MGVVTYFLLVGYTPFNRASPKEEDMARIAGTYKFEPKKYWENISEVACSFVRACLAMDPQQRLTAAQALDHPVCNTPNLILNLKPSTVVVACVKNPTLRVRFHKHTQRAHRFTAACKAGCYREDVMSVSTGSSSALSKVIMIY
jgi:serine/threonine protein kinase